MRAILDDLRCAPEGPLDFADRAHQAPGTGRDLLLRLASAEEAVPDHEALTRHLTPGGALLVALPGSVGDAALARLRDRLWPAFHAVAVYRSVDGGLRRTTMGGTSPLEGSSEGGTVLALRRTAWVLSPEATVEKFDLNASGWNGEPGRPGYAHFRWMRRFVALYAPLPTQSGLRVLDFGCGAGWVGIEAARRMRDPELCFFDPSPEMVRIAADNARAEGIARATGRTGFGEQPPFPAPGEEAFDVVISSGVLSFSPDLEAWLDGLAAACKPGASLVVGDIDPGGRGFARRRRARPLLPVRELNGRRPEVIRAGLEARGFRWRVTSGYQLSFPVPELMHVSQTKLGGLLNPPLLWANQALAGLDRRIGHRLDGLFDSWVMALDAPR